MKKYLIALSFLIFGCASSTKMSSSIKEKYSKIKRIHILPIYTHIERVDKESTVDSVAQNNSIEMINEIIKKWNSKAVILDSAQIDDKIKFDSTSLELRHSVRLFKDFNSIKADSILGVEFPKSHGDYAAIIFMSGFYRSASNKAASFGKSLFIGVITLGMFIPVSMTAGTQIEVLIFDAKDGEVIYYDIAGGDSDPKNQKSIDKYFNKAIRKFNEINEQR